MKLLTNKQHKSYKNVCNENFKHEYAKDEKYSKRNGRMD